MRPIRIFEDEVIRGRQQVEVEKNSLIVLKSPRQDSNLEPITKIHLIGILLDVWEKLIPDLRY